MPSTRSQLPKTGTDGQEILDLYGNRWRYDLQQKLWVSIGTVSAPTIVTEDEDGIIDPTIFEKLQKLKTYVQSGVNLSPLKLLPGRNAYWYYFKSSNRLIKFKPEADNILRVEFDQGRFYQLMSKQICPGFTGPDGITGPTGEDGTNTQSEPCYSPSRIVGKQLDFAIFTATPILDDSTISLPNDHVPEISVRLYRLQTAAASTLRQIQALGAMYRHIGGEVEQKFAQLRDAYQQRAMGARADNLCNIELSEVLIGASTETNPAITIEIDPLNPDSIEIVSTDVVLDETRTLNSIQFDPVTGIVCGSIFLAEEDWGNDWCVKSWQKGPDGFTGVSGNCRIAIVECVIDDTNYLATCPIINARLDCERSTIYKLCSGLMDEYCVTNIQILPNSGTLTTGDALHSTFASAQMTLDDCKHINRFQISIPEEQIPDLDLAHWDPQPGCFTQRHYDRYKFDWVPLTNREACTPAIKWYSATGIRRGRYPYELITAPEPPADECCQDEFFYCPNVQDGPCPE